MTSTFRSCQVGATARALLKPGACGQVLAGFSGAAYLVTAEGELLWLTSDRVPMHARGLRIAGQFPQFVAGERFSTTRGGINIAPDLQVDLNGASTWEASAIGDNAALDIDKIPPKLKDIFSDGVDLSRATGLAFGTGGPGISFAMR